MDRVIVGIAEGKTAHADQVLVSYALGSCVGICLYDAQQKLAGMAHIILPDDKKHGNCENPYKFAKSGVPSLVYAMELAGAKRTHLTAKIAGGANMFRGVAGTWEIGRQNIEAVRRALKEADIPLIAEDTGRDYGRTISFSGQDGSLEISTVKQIKKLI